MAEAAVEKPLFRDIDADDESEQVVVESLCMACQENGTTRLLLTKIPHFKEIVISSFECPHCGLENKEVQSAGEIQEKGCVITLRAKSLEDLGRQIVKSEAASLRIPELDFEVPNHTQPGIFSTVEGILQRTIDGLEQQQVVRRAMDPALADGIDNFIGKIRHLMTGKQPFQFILDDCSGNSCIESLDPPAPDAQLQERKYVRSEAQNTALGLATPAAPHMETVAEVPDGSEDLSSTAAPSNGEAGPIDSEEVLSIRGNCANCRSPVENLMKPIDIPMFKQVIIMAVKCDRCGYKSNEVKAAGGIESQGVRITLEMSEEADLSRDMLVSETATLAIPTYDLQVNSFAGSGSFTTTEGVLRNMKSQLEKVNALSLGDSSDPARASKLKGLLARLDKAISGEEFVTIKVDDPAGNSYIQNLFAPDPDPCLTVERYERSREQNDELGISDMMVSEDAAAASSDAASTCQASADTSGKVSTSSPVAATS